MADLESGWQAVSGCCLCGAALLQRRLGALGRRCSLLLLDLPCCSLALARATRECCQLRSVLTCLDKRCLFAL